MINTLRAKFLGAIQNKKINIFLLFLILSFIILIFTKLSKTYANTIAFKIKRVNVPEERVVLNTSDSTLNMTLSTHGFKWLSYYFNRPEIIIDFSKDVIESGSKYIWTRNNARLFNTSTFTNQVKIIAVYPDTLFFTFDVNSIRKIPVELRQNISFSPGYDSFSGFLISPDSIKVIGPEHVIDTISAIETEMVSLKDVKSNIDITVKLDLPKSLKEVRYTNSDVNLNAEVERFTEGNLKIPITVINTPDDLKLNYFPKEVTISFYTSLNQFNLVKPNDFRVICDYSKLNSEGSFFIPEIVKTSEHVKSVKINNQRVEIIILE